MIYTIIAFCIGVYIGMAMMAVFAAGKNADMRTEHTYYKCLLKRVHCAVARAQRICDTGDSELLGEIEKAIKCES